METPEYLRPYPTVKQAWVLFLIFIGMNIGATVVAIPFQNTAADLGFFLAYVAGMGATYLLARKLKRDEEPGFVQQWQPGPWQIYPVLLLLTWACLIIINPIVELYPPPEWLEELLEELIDTSSIWAFLSIVVAAPILEELIFRGIMLDGFLKRYSVRRSILWSSFFFGLFHLNPWQFVTAMLLGILLGWVYHRTRSLLPCIAIHAFANGTSFWMSASLSEEQLAQSSIELMGGTGQFLAAVALAGLILYVGIRLLDRWLPPAPAMIPPEERQRHLPSDEPDLLDH